MYKQSRHHGGLFGGLAPPKNAPSLPKLKHETLSCFNLGRLGAFFPVHQIDPVHQSSPKVE